jgi:2Fe-2S iron-sulfur cluster binding domain
LPKPSLPPPELSGSQIIPNASPAKYEPRKISAGVARAFVINVNGTHHGVDVDDDTPALWVLRDVLGMSGTKFGCGAGLCAACTVHIDGARIRSCITSIDSGGNSQITTIEAIGRTVMAPKFKKPGSISRSFAVFMDGDCQDWALSTNPKVSPTPSSYLFAFMPSSSLHGV